MNDEDLPQHSTVQLLALLDHVKAAAGGGANSSDPTKSYSSALSAQTERSQMSSVVPDAQHPDGEPSTAHQLDALFVANLTRERASLSSKVRQLEQQVSELESIAQEKHMEIQRLQSDREEVGPLREELRSLQAELRSRIDPKKAVREGTAVSKEELDAVRQDLVVQERIITALEKDNEQLMAEKKSLVARLKQLEVGAAHSEAKHAIQQSGAASLNVSAQNAGESAGLTTDQLSKQLQEVRLALQKSQTVELELRFEIDSLKKEKREAERRAGEFDGTKAEQAALEARQLKVQLKRQDEAHGEVVRDMARKIAWYVDHQEFNRAQETLIQEQQETIQQLRLRVMEAESLVTKSGVARTDKDKQIRALQKQVAELEAAMREKNPNSIAQLIRSCQPPIQHSAVFAELQTKVKSLTEELQQKEQTAQQMLDRMRVESDRVRLQYQQRLEKLEEEMKVRVLHAQTRKVKDLEKQLTDARKYYSEKLREQETIISLLRRGVHTSPSSVASQAHSDGGQHPAQTGKTSRGRTSKQDHAPTTSSCSGTQTEASGHDSAMTADERGSQPAGAVSKWAATTLALQQENTQLKQQLEAMAQSALTAASSVTVPMGLTSLHVASTLQAQVQLLQSELAVAKRLLVESQEDARIRVERLEDRIAGMKRDSEKERALLQQQFAEERQRLNERHQAETKLLLDRFEAGQRLWSAPSGSVRSGHGSAQQYLALVSERLQMLEYRQTTKEVEAQREMEEIRRVAMFEVSLEKQKAELIVSQKNQEIERFRTELDVLLNDLAQLRIASAA